MSLATELDMYIIFGCVEREEGGDDVFNTAFVCGPTEGISASSASEVRRSL